MARFDPSMGVMPSILDRLIDPDSAGTSAQPGYTLEKILACVRRDLEELLNTRFTLGDTCKDRKHLARSMHAFGLPDLVSLNATTPQERAQIAKALEKTVAQYEPRLSNIRAFVLDTDKPNMVRFRLEARLTVEPAPDVIFDTMMELTTGQTSVRESIV